MICKGFVLGWGEEVNLRVDFILQAADEEDGDFCDAREGLFSGPILVAQPGYVFCWGEGALV